MVGVEAQAGFTFQDRHAHLLGGAGIHRALVDHHRHGAGTLGGAGFEYLAHRGTGLFQSREIGTLGAIDRGGHRHHDNIGCSQQGWIAGELQQVRTLQMTNGILLMILGCIIAKR
jgi:hypothetical protein